MLPQIKHFNSLLALDIRFPLPKNAPCSPMGNKNERSAPNAGSIRPNLIVKQISYFIKRFD